jgi:precorrin-4/cobalt-precorrin-4 C11-methyltransferase
MPNRVFFIGAGPGDPDLLTLRGARLLSSCRAVFLFPPFEETFAALLEGKTFFFPSDFSSFSELTRQIEALLTEGDVVFLVPGDLTFFSPFQAVIEWLGDRAEVVPGVGTANAASAALKRTLDLPDACNRAVIVSPRVLTETEGAPSLREVAAPGVTLLIYMNNLPLPELVTELRAGYGKNVPIALLHRLCLPGQLIITGTLDDIVARTAGRDLFRRRDGSVRSALTLVIVGETLTATADTRWWDKRLEETGERDEGNE